MSTDKFGKQGWTPERLGSLKGKTYVITGANAGAGFEATKLFLSKGAEVVMLNRNAEKSKDAITDLKNTFGENAPVSFIKMDLAELDSVRKAAKEAGRDPKNIEFPVLVFPEVSESDLGSDRQPMNGSIEQIAQDLNEFEKLGVDHVNLVFDFGSIATDLDKRLSHAKQIKEAVK